MKWGEGRGSSPNPHVYRGGNGDTALSSHPRFCWHSTPGRCTGRCWLPCSRGLHGCTTEGTTAPRVRALPASLYTDRRWWQDPRGPRGCFWMEERGTEDAIYQTRFELISLLPRPSHQRQHKEQQMSTKMQQEGACEGARSTHFAVAKAGLAEAGGSTPRAVWQVMSVSAELKV